LKEKYKVVWEMSMKSIIEMAADRGPYICQSMSMNLWVEDPNYKNLTAMHFYAWSKKLKTGIYYLRRKPKHNPQQFTIEPNKTNDSKEEDCLMCGS
jgi:ribonucleotide reductase alpha subunit